MPRPRLCRLIFRRLNATSRFKKSYFCPESDEPIHRRRFNDGDATLGDVDVTITIGSLVICSVHIDLLIDANPIVDKCRQMRRWHTTWRCNRFSAQWEQTETETQPTAKRENTEMTKLDQRYSSYLFNQN
ncbi:hypothetical protein T02_5363 [Trichinella nativa]|uniref:Uncharacterized protein n=1 Tax=Trichinella nativa TaxID=6335 RepID=A0A0V1LUU1_9BILA|nr:hypothetical protein T02_5363 [Trichinella nativa]